jgi:squalene-hopene/tetraprenyl-beta-curcumene cyclase
MLNVDQRFRESLARAHETACEALLAERTSEGFWVGELSSSALATATAISALSLVRESTRESGDFKTQISNLIECGLRWLADHQNADGGWGDTTLSRSNISTTMLVRAAFQLAGATSTFSTILGRASEYVDHQGSARAMVARYGKDRTFAVPILANCALAGQAEWSEVASLPFELAWLPHSWFRLLRLHVVSYALPALIAIGQLIHAKRPSWNLFARWIRNRATGPTLKKLEAIQPSSGGFLEAIPLTSFVTMSLAASGRVDHPVARKGLEFLANTARPDGSWPIDSNLSIWLTTLSVNALANAPPGTLAHDWLQSPEAVRVRDWLLAQQIRDVHPYTNAAPGGWGWSHLSGSVPDADDTAGALLALRNLPSSEDSFHAQRAGFQWLKQLRNRDGGWPTFCRGWGKLPFDRSGPDLTAHVIRAVAAWAVDTEFSVPAMDESLGLDLNFDFSHPRTRRYLDRTQRPDGSWIPLWFGNEHVAHDENPTYGTARVLKAYRDTGRFDADCEPALRAVEWLLRAQDPDGGWGGGPGTPSSVEETGLAIEALAEPGASEAVQAALSRGVQWLIDRVESGDWRKPSPIGLYFAKLWYFEKLYPMIFTAAALGRARRALSC